MRLSKLALAVLFAASSMMVPGDTRANGNGGQDQDEIDEVETAQTLCDDLIVDFYIIARGTCDISVIPDIGVAEREACEDHLSNCTDLGFEKMDLYISCLEEIPPCTDLQSFELAMEACRIEGIEDACPVETPESHN